MEASDGLSVCLFFWLSCSPCGILVPQPGIEPMSPTVEVQLLTTGPPGNSQKGLFIRGWGRVGWGNPETNQSADVFKYIGILQVWGEEKNKS